jgi:hypothetical protein
MVTLVIGCLLALKWPRFMGAALIANVAWGALAGYLDTSVLLCGVAGIGFLAWGIRRAWRRVAA